MDKDMFLTAMIVKILSEEFRKSITGIQSASQVSFCPVFEDDRAMLLISLPVEGLPGIYEWKGKEKIPEKLIEFFSEEGFQEFK
jgi:hypothetical protein